MLGRDMIVCAVAVEFLLSMADSSQRWSPLLAEKRSTYARSLPVSDDRRSSLKYRLQCFYRPNSVESARSGVRASRNSDMAEEEAARQSKELQALTRSNAALRCLLSLQSRRAAAEPSRNASGGDSAVPESLERYERLIEAVKLLREDLQLERKKTKLLLSRQMYADVARFVLFIAGSFAILTVFQPDFPSALRDYVYSEVDKLGYSIRW